jgi:hypothetical protein
MPCCNCRIGALADYLPRRTLFLGCAVLLLLSSWRLRRCLDTWLILADLGAVRCQRRGLVYLVVNLIGERYRDDALVRANAHIAQLWGALVA